MKIKELNNNINEIIKNLINITSLNELQKYIKQLLDRVILLKKLKKEKESYILNQKKFNNKKIKFMEILNKFKLAYKGEKNNLKDKIINKKLKIIDWRKIIKYSSKISNSIQGPDNYKKNNNMLPWSYNLNVIETLDIENSNLNRTLKNNFSYEKCKLPEIFNDNPDIQIIANKNKYTINSVNPIVIKIKKIHKKDIILIKKNGYIPTFSDFEILNSDNLNILNTSIIKLRVFQLGKLLSEVLSIEININENKINNFGKERMERIIVNTDIYENDFHLDFDEIINDENYLSLKNNGFLSNTSL